MADEITIEQFTGDNAPENAEALSDEQKTFLNDHKDDLDDATAEKYGIDKSAAPYIPEAPKGGEGEGEGKGKGKEGNEGSGDDDDLDPEDERKLGKLVDKRLAPALQQVNEQRTATAVDSFIRDIATSVPSAAKYRDAMLQTSKIPGYQNLSPKELFRICAGDELMRIGAQKERAAAAKAKGTQTQNSSGGRPATSGGQRDWGSASKEDFEAEKARVLGRTGN